MKALPKILLALTAVTALSVAYPASVQADTIYTYTGNNFTTVTFPYTTSDFVTAMITLATPLPPNFSGTVNPTAFTLSDGVQTLTNLNAVFAQGFITTSPTGAITTWHIQVQTIAGAVIETVNDTAFPFTPFDLGQLPTSITASNDGMPGTWTVVGQVPDTGSTLLLMTLTLMAMGVAAWQFKRAAA